MKKLFTIWLVSVVVFCMSISLAGCNKTSVIPEGNYAISSENNEFSFTEEDIRDAYGWVIKGNTAEQWTSSVCEYKAKIVEQDGQILFDGYRWLSILDLLLGDKDKNGSDCDYIVEYNAGVITLTPKMPQENTEYRFDGITFEKSDNLKIEDLSNYIPVLQAKEIKSVKDFEKLILDNLDSYCLDIWKDTGTERVYFTPKYYSVTLKEENILSLTESEGGEPYEVSCTPISNGRRWDYVTEKETFRWDGSATLSYVISFPMDIPNGLEIFKYFRVVYNYKVK